MIEPAQPTPEQVAYWTKRDGCEQQAVIVGGPEEGDGVVPCPALIAAEARAAHVAFELTPDDLAELVRGGTLWLTTWGNFPIHRVEIVARADLEPADEPVRCPVCGEPPASVERIESGMGGPFHHEIPGTYHCANEDDEEHRLYRQHHNSRGQRVVRDNPQA